MKWLLLALLVFLVASGRGKLGDLISTVRRLPKDFKDGKKSVDAPDELARDVTPKADTQQVVDGAVNPSKESVPRS